MDIDPSELSSNEPDIPSTNPNTNIKDTFGIYWGFSNGWSTETNKLGYPRPQSTPMINSLTADKRRSLLKAYYDINPS